VFHGGANLNYIGSMTASLVMRLVARNDYAVTPHTYTLPTVRFHGETF
jgi:hypothetical protein